MAGDWYKKRLDELDSWHAGFKAQTIATGTTHGLSAGQVSQAGLDADLVSILVDYDAQLRGYVEAFTAYRDFLLRGDKNAPLPDPPTAPVLVIPENPFLPGIEPRTRDMANIIKADTDYTTSVGEDYGIVSPVSSGPTTPSLKVAALVGTSDVEIKIAKGGHSMIAIDMQRGGGDWTEIKRVGTANTTDTTPALVDGQPEKRNYRAQGIVSDARVGAMSDVASTVTSP